MNVIWSIKEVAIRLNQDGRTGERGKAALDRALAEGWEPYAVVPSTPWSLVHYLKRSQP
jgi:hypothetical protein